MFKIVLFSFASLFSIFISGQVMAECTPVSPCLPGLIEEGDALNSGVATGNEAIEPGAQATTQSETSEGDEGNSEATQPQQEAGILDPRCKAAKEHKTRVCTPSPRQDRSEMSQEAVSQAESAEGVNAVAQEVVGAATTGVVVNAIVADECKAAGESCVTECEADAKSLDATLPLEAKRIRSDGLTCEEEALQAVLIYNRQVVTNLKARNDALNTVAASHSSGGLAQSGAADMPGSSGGGGAPAGDAVPASSGGGGGGNMMGMMLGAAAGLGALCMTGTICDDGKKDEDNKSADMPVNCQKDEGAYKKSECKDYFLLQCTGYLSAPGCEDFSPYYCGVAEREESGTGNGEESSKTSTASTYQEGAGSDYCQIVVATQYCQRSGREACPSCQNLARMTSDACKENPSVCLPQMTIEDKQMAQNTCPTDPMFSDPQFASGKSFNPELNSELNSESLPDGTGPAANVALSGNAAYNTSHRGPASEVGRSVGPSVFSQTSGAIKKRCLEGRLNNCGIRSFTADEAFTH